MSAAIQYDQSDAPPALADAVRCVWRLRGEWDGSTQPIVSDGCVEIVLNLADPFEEIVDSGATRQPLAMVVGPTAQPTVVRPTGAIDIVGIRIQPWAAASVLGVAMHELRDRKVRLADVVRGAVLDLPDQLHGTRLDSARSAAVHASLRAWLPQRPVGVARRAVEEVAKARELPSVRELARRLGRSTRTIQRVFAHDVGVSPKALVRIVRIQRSLRLALTQPELKWSAIAARSGYHDQPHFVRDFQALVGCSPSEFRPEVEALTAAFVDAG